MSNSTNHQTSCVEVNIMKSTDIKQHKNIPGSVPIENIANGTCVLYNEETYLSCNGFPVIKGRFMRVENEATNRGYSLTLSEGGPYFLPSETGVFPMPDCYCNRVDAYWKDKPITF